MPDVPSVPGLAVLLACESRQTAGVGKPGGMLRVPEAALNGEAGRGAGISNTSTWEYGADPEEGDVAAVYVGGRSAGTSLTLLRGEGENP